MSDSNVFVTPAPKLAPNSRHAKTQLCANAKEFSPQKRKEWLLQSLETDNNDLSGDSYCECCPRIHPSAMAFTAMRPTCHPPHHYMFGMPPPHPHPHGHWNMLPQFDNDLDQSFLDSVKCYHCGVIGHYASHCPRSDYPALCFFCQKEGHFQSECPLKRHMFMSAQRTMSLERSPLELCGVWKSGDRPVTRHNRSRVHIPLVSSTGREQLPNQKINNTSKHSHSRLGPILNVVEPDSQEEENHENTRSLTKKGLANRNTYSMIERKNCTGIDSQRVEERSRESERAEKKVIQHENKSPDIVGSLKLSVKDTIVHLLKYVHAPSVTKVKIINSLGAYLAENLECLGGKIGTKLGPLEYGQMACGGISQVKVYKRPRVALINIADSDDSSQGVAPMLSKLIPQAGAEMKVKLYIPQNRNDKSYVRIGEVIKDIKKKITAVDLVIIASKTPIASNSHGMATSVKKALDATSCIHEVTSLPNVSVGIHSLKSRKILVFSLPSDLKMCCKSFDLLVPPILLAMQGGGENHKLLDPH